MKIAWDNLVSVHISMFYAQRLPDGVLDHFAERWWGRKTFSMFKMGYEIFANCTKLTSALVPRTKNDCSLTLSFFDNFRVPVIISFFVTFVDCFVAVIFINSIVQFFLLIPFE